MKIHHFIPVLIFLLGFLEKPTCQSFDEFSVDKEVSIFLKDHFDGLKNFSLGIPCPEEENKWYLDSIDYSPWYVGDLNGDKILDLFVTGKQKKDQVHYLVLGKNEEDETSTFTLIQVTPPKIKGNLQIPFIEETKKGNFIIFKQFETNVKTIVRDGQEIRLPKTYKDYYKMGLIKKDSLIYRFGDLVEYNPNPDSRQIEYIQVHFFCQFGGCPDFRMKIDEFGQMLLHNISNTTEEPGMYAAACDPDALEQIFALANYLRLDKSLQKFGEDNADKTITTVIQYKDEKYKSWYDYEQGASLGMIRLYEMLLKAKESASWEFKQ